MALFQGISHPFGKTSASFPAKVSDDDLVKQSIVQLLLTARGERVMRPDVGSRVYDFVFENNDDVLNEMIRSEVMGVIGRFEPRALVQDVQVTNQREKGSVVVDVVYVVRSTRTQNRVVMEIPKG